mgnify:CR=1 FL=1
MWQRAGSPPLFLSSRQGQVKFRRIEVRGGVEQFARVYVSKIIEANPSVSPWPLFYHASSLQVPAKPETIVSNLWRRER